MKENHNKFKLIALDMDCTLLNKEKKVSKRNKEALMKAMAKGVKIILTTGRIYPSARHYAKQLDIQTPIIACNGSFIKNQSTGEIIYKNPVPDDVNIEFIRLSRERQLYPDVLTYDSIYTEKLVNAAYRYSLYNNDMNDEDKINIVIVDKLEDLAKVKSGEILRITVADENGDGKAIDCIRDSLRKMDNATISKSADKNLEAVNKGVDKGQALKILCESYGIKREDIIAMGDQENDITMIEYAGLGIAMKNAADNVKAKADYITGCHTEDGVAQAIEKFVL